MKQKYSISRRTAGWLMALLTAFVVVHYAYHSSPRNLSQAVTGQPAIQVALRGEITGYNNSSVSLTLEDPHGDLTTLTRNVEVTDKTQYMTPGEPGVMGSEGMKYLKKGYRVYVKGQGTADNQVIAQLVHVSFPPITGTVSSLSGSLLSVKVTHQNQPAAITMTSHTAIYVPNGDWSKLAVGSPVKVWVIPGTASESSELQALSVMVLLPASTSAGQKL